MTDRTLTAEEVWTQIASENVCIMATPDDEGIRARPMGPMVRQDDGVIWFITDRNSHKVRDLADDTPVTLIFQNSASNWYISLMGTASVVDDRGQVRELWSPILKEWFEGPDDPKIILLAFEPTEADYWNGPNRLVAGLKMLITAATGMKTDMGDAGKVSM